MSSLGTAPSVVKPLVTLSGEFFDAQYEEAGHAGVDRDGTLYYFKVVDLAKARGTRSVSLFMSGPERIFIEDYDTRIKVVRLNRLRRAFDSGEFTFETPVRSGYYHELHLRSEDFQRREHANDEGIRKFVKLAGYWLGFRLRPDVPNFFIDFDCAEDLDYLGVTKEDLARNLWLMRKQDYFTATFGSLKVTPTRKLIEEMENPLAVEDEDRKFARMAIDEARKSVSESDERPHPKVGAVVVKNGQVLSTAHRGEATGNHAEFLALEKKLSDAAVAGATVYTTLEPCTTRNHPKIPCAERLIERKVARVVIGMLDPDNRISGRGQRRLRKAGIATEFFPPDLMTEVEELNREFIRFCEQRPTSELIERRNRPEISIEWDSGRRSSKDIIRFRNVGAISAFNVRVLEFSWPELSWHRQIEVQAIHPGDKEICVEAQFSERIKDGGIYIGYMSHVLDSKDYRGRDPLSVDVTFSDADRTNYTRTFIIRNGPSPGVVVEMGEIKIKRATIAT